MITRRYNRRHEWLTRLIRMKMMLELSEEKFDQKSSMEKYVLDLKQKAVLLRQIMEWAKQNDWSYEQFKAISAFQSTKYNHIKQLLSDASSFEQLEDDVHSLQSNIINWLANKNKPNLSTKKSESPKLKEINNAISALDHKFNDERRIDLLQKAIAIPNINMAFIFQSYVMNSPVARSKKAVKHTPELGKSVFQVQKLTDLLNRIEREIIAFSMNSGLHIDDNKTNRKCIDAMRSLIKLKSILANNPLESGISEQVYKILVNHINCAYDKKLNQPAVITGGEIGNVAASEASALVAKLAMHRGWHFRWQVTTSIKNLHTLIDEQKVDHHFIRQRAYSSATTASDPNSPQ